MQCKAKNCSRVVFKIRQLFKCETALIRTDYSRLQMMGYCEKGY